MRIYDPRLGKFLSVDPLTSSYPELTPYQFSGNTPIQATDLDGAETFIQRQGNATRRYAEIKIAKAEQIRIQSEKWRYPEPHILLSDIYGNGHMGPESIVRQNVAAIKNEQNDAVAAAIRGGPFGAAGYMIGGDESALKWSVADGVMMSFGGLPAGESSVFPRQTQMQRVKAVAQYGVRANRFFGKMHPLVKSTAEAIEAAMPNSVLSVEREVISPITRKTLTDFDIELNDFIIEVNDGYATGKLKQIKNNIQPNTKKEVILFSPKMGGAVEKSMKENGIKAFRNVKDLMEYININRKKEL